MLGPLQTWNLLWVLNTYFSRWKYRLNMAVDLDVGYDGAEFNSVCCKYSQSFFFIQYGYRGYYMAARENEFYLWVLKVFLTRSLRSLVRDTFSSYPQVAMECSVYFIDTDKNSYIKHNFFFYSFSKQQTSAIKVVTYRKMPVKKMLWNSDIRL